MLKPEIKKAWNDDGDPVVGAYLKQMVRDGLDKYDK